MAYGFQGLKSLGLEGEQTQEAPMSLPVKQPEYDPSGYASFAKPSVSDTKGEIKQSPRDIVTAKYGYTPGQMPGINKDVAGVQGTAFNNWDDTTKQSIRKSIAETPVVKKPSVKEAVRKAGYNPDQSLADLSATLIANGGDITPEDLQMKFPEFAGKEQAVSDFIATMAATPNITPEEVKMKFPEFYDQQATGMDGGLRATAARGNEERSIYSKIGDALNPAGLLTEFIDNVAQKIPVFDPEAYVDRKTGERVGELTPEKVAEYYKKYESSPNAKKLFGSFDEYIKAKHMTLLEGLIDSPTITMYANMPGSFAKNYSGIARGIENPVDTAIGLYKLAATPEGHAMLMQRYGTQKGREDAIKYDPVGVASDLLTIVEGGANLTRLSAKGTSLVAKAAGAEKLAAGATKVATQAGEVARVAGGASNLGADIAINKGFNALGSLAKGNKIAEKAVKAVKFAQAPVSETFKVAREGAVGEFATRTLPVSRIEKALGLTPTERGNVESTGVSAGEYMLQKNLGGLEKEEQISRLANIADESYNGVTKELKKIPLNVRTASEPAKKMLQVMVDEMESSKIVADAYPDYISKLKEMIAQKDYHPEELNAIKRDFDKIVGSKMYNSKGRVTNFEDGIIDGYRKELYSQLETVANEHGLDIRGMNTDMRNAMTIRNGLIRRASQVNKNNTFGLQDIGIGAILAAGDPVTATAVVLAKKGIEQAVPGISQKLYNLNPKKTGSNPNLKRGVPVSPRDKSNGMSITNTAADRRILAGKIEADYKTKNPALPEKSQGYTLGTKKNPIVAGLPEGYVAKPVKDLSNMEKIAATPQDAPKKGYETKIGKVTDITNNGGAYPTYRVKVEGSDKRHNIDEIGGVYKPKTEAKMPRQEKTDAPNQESEGLKVAPGGKKEYYLKLIKEEYGLDINKMETADMLKVKDAINSRTPAKAEEILKGLQEKYKGKKYKRQDLYHGTAAGNEFNTFDRTKKGTGVGSNAIDQGDHIYLTENQYAAEYFGKLATERKQMLVDKKMPTGDKGNVLKFELGDNAKVLDVDNMPRGKDAAEKIIQKAKADGYDAIRFYDKGFDTIEGQSKDFYDNIYKDGKPPKTVIVINESKLKRSSNVGKGSLTVDEAKTYVQKYFKEGEVSAKFVEGMTTPEGRTALGAYADGLIEFTKNPTKELLDHEALHAYIDKFTDTTRRDAVYKAAQEKHALEIGGIQKKYGISKLEATEEWIADGFAEYAAGKRTFTGKVASYFKTLWNDIKTVFGKGDAVKSLYKDLETGKRTTGLIDKSGKPMKVFRRDDAVLYRAGGLEDKNKTGIFLSNDKSVADNYKDTGLGGKTTLAYKIDENANLYKGENRRQLIQELDPMYAKGRDEREYKWAKQYKGEGPTAQQKSQRETEKRIKMILQKKGYDGVEYNGKGNDQAGEYQIFDKKTLQPEGLKPKMYKRGDVQSPQEYIKSKVTAYDDGIGRFEKKFGTRPKNIDELVATVMKDKEKLKYYTGYEDATKMKDELEHVFDKPAKTNYFENKPLYHGTDAKSAESIVKGGFDTSKASKVAEEPYAVFASLHKDEGPGYSAGTYGDTILRVVPNGKVAVLSPSDGLKYKVLYGDMPFHKDVRESTFNKIKELGYDAIEQENGEVIILNKDMFKLSNMKDNGLKAKDNRNTMGLKLKK